MIFGYRRRSPNDIGRGQYGLMIPTNTLNIFFIELDTLDPDVIRQAGSETDCPPILDEHVRRVAATENPE
jgi:hypothetical protein